MNQIYSERIVSDCAENSALWLMTAAVSAGSTALEHTIYDQHEDGYGTENLYVAIVQILTTDSVKPSAATTGLFNRLTEYNITASCHQLH